jgi:hypothetical protein
MSKERLPEPSGWKERLGDPQGLHEWGLTDKEAAWDKLHARLGKKLRRAGASWYWAAACCLILAGMTILLREKHVETAGMRSHTNSGRSVQTGPASGAGIQEQDQVIGKGPLSISSRSAKPDGMPKTFAPGHIAYIPGGAHTPARASIPIVGVDKGFPLAGPIDPLSDSPIRGAKLEPHPVKPLRVVHVNELDPPSGSSSSLAGNSSPSLWLKWGRGHAPDTGLYSAREDPVQLAHPIITIHLSSQN